jgi:hypothetical protein
MDTWIECTYHRHRRRRAALGRLTWMEFEAIMTAPAMPPVDFDGISWRPAEPRGQRAVPSIMVLV